MTKAELLEALQEAPDDSMVYVMSDGILRSRVVASVFAYDDGDHEIVIEFTAVAPVSDE